jgi:glycosyltransferase involved in cell wall biosynthesis
MARTVERRYGPLAGVRVISNARDRGLFRPLEKEPYVLTAGRLWDEAKNVAAVDAVASRVPWAVYVAGDENGASRHEAGARRLGRLAAVELAGWLGQASVYALPARYEPFGLSVLEAAMAGCALVLGDIPSLRENWSGAAAFVPPDDHDALAAALNRLIADDDRRHMLSQLARDRAQSFSPDRVAADYLHVYQGLLPRSAVAASHRADARGIATSTAGTLEPR